MQECLCKALESPHLLQASESPEEEEQTTGRNLQLPTQVIQRLRNVIFGFDFFVTSVENYQANGVIFKGNLRGDASDAYDRIAARLKVFIAAYMLILIAQYAATLDI